MGYSLTYMAVKGKTPEAILAELGLTTTNEFGGFAETPFCAAPLPDGWYLVCENNSAEFTREPLLKQLSLNCEVITCSVEEHVMASSASAWQNGNELWSILHESHKGSEHLETKGTLPATFAAIHDELTAKQEASKLEPPGKWGRVDHIFEIPVSIVQSLIGFTYYKDCPGVPDDSFQVLTSIVKPQSAKSQSGLKKFFNSLFSQKTKS